MNFKVLAGAAFAAIVAPCWSKADTAGFRGTAALADAKHAVSFGPRPSGSEANKRQREWILAELHAAGGQITEDAFEAKTPKGAVKMVNIVARFPGTDRDRTGTIVISGHYDTKQIANTNFVGANDGGSSTGFLLEFAHFASAARHKEDWCVVFFDGEEAVDTWSDVDSLYGSRHLAARWNVEGMLKSVRALINVDMVGDRDLQLVLDMSSSPDLRKLAVAAALKTGHEHLFSGGETGMDDDHRPFAELGVEVLDLIDFQYGPHNSYWHTASDTGDKLSAKSLQTIGDTVSELCKELDGGAK